MKESELPCLKHKAVVHKISAILSPEVMKYTGA